MTREEAIRLLTTKRAQPGTDWQMAEVYTMAIEALQKEPCDDCISRQAVLSYIYNDLGLGDEENGADVGRQIELEKSYQYIKSLPSVPPQPKIGAVEKEIMSNGFVPMLSDEIIERLTKEDVNAIIICGRKFVLIDKVLESIEISVEAVIAVECLSADCVFKDDSTVGAVARFGRRVIKHAQTAIEELKGGDKE